jgi:hypothetical protein
MMGTMNKEFIKMINKNTKTYIKHGKNKYVKLGTLMKLGECT